MDLAYEFSAEAGEITPDLEGVETTLLSLHARGQTAWPAIEVPAAAFARHLGTLWASRKPQLAALCAEDLYLACACAAGAPRALGELDRLLAAACVALPGGTPASSDEIRQLLRERLLVAAGDEAPRIATYSGEGPLAVWLKVIALRVALKQRARTAREVELTDAHLEEPDQPDPELDYLKLRHGEDFRAAFRDAARSLEPRDRTMLRLYSVEGLGVVRIGAIYQVNPSTVSRRLAAARETLLLETRRLLQERLRLSGSEVESLLGILRSRAQVSLRRILESDEQPPSG